MTTSSTDAAETDLGPPDDGARRRAVTAAAGWAVALVGTWALGRVLSSRGTRLVLGDLPPFIGTLEVRVGPALLLATLIAVVVVVRGPRWTATWRWSVVLLAGWGAAAAFAVALAATAGLDALAAPLRSPHDYLAVVPDAARDVGGFVASFVDNAAGYPIHVRGHPPGLVVVLAVLERAGLGGAGWAAALDVAVGTSAVVAVGVTVRALGGVGGERTMRRALPALVLAPAAVWVATAPDAFFAGVLAWGVALLAVASTRRAWWPWALGAGVLLGACPFLSYGLLPMGLLALVPVVLTRRLAPTVLAGAVVLVSAAAWAAAGFWLPDGIAVTHIAWHDGRASARPYLYFLLADAVLLGALVGPAGVGGLAGLRRLPRAPRLLVVVAVVAALAGALLGYERGEVERIWLPLAPWVLLATATLPGSRGWLAAQATTAVLLQVVLASPW